MATRTQKAATRKTAGTPEAAQEATPTAKEAKARTSGKGKAGARPAKTGGKAASRSSKSNRGKARRGKDGKPLLFDEVQTGPGWPDVLDTVRAKQPGFFERLRQRRAENAARRAEENKRREAERIEARERQRRLEAEQRAAREAQEAVERAEREVREAAERAQREEQEKAERLREAAEARKMKAAMKRAEARAAKEEAARLEAEAAAAKAAEEARLAAEKEAEEAAAKEAARAKREQQKAEREQAALLEAETEEAAKQKRAAERQRKREELEAAERRKAEEQAAKDAEAEVEARRLAANKKFQDEEKQRKAAARELEPDLEFEEASKPVKDSDALVPAKGGATSADVQAELMAAELAKRRSKPIVVVGDIPEPPKIPKAPLRPGETFEPPTPSAQPIPMVQEGRADAQPTDTFGFSIPEAFLLLANGGGWDERAEKNKEGTFGGALAGAMVLELLMRGQVIVQRDRIVLTGEPVEDEALAPIVGQLNRIREKKGDLTSLQQMGRLAAANRTLLEPFKQRLADKGMVQHGSRKHLGLFHRSWVEVTDEAAQERLQNRLRRAIAGGGTPEAASILLLGLLDASGLFGTVVPDEAADYNRKRLNGLLGGRDIMGYKVDPQLKALQEIATRTILGNVRLMTVRG